MVSDQHSYVAGTRIIGLLDDEQASLIQIVLDVLDVEVIDARGCAPLRRFACLMPICFKKPDTRPYRTSTRSARLQVTFDRCAARRLLGLQKADLMRNG